MLIWAAPVFGLCPTVLLESTTWARQHKPAEEPPPDAGYLGPLYAREAELGALLGLEPQAAAERIEPCAPLSRAERTEWESLVQRLQRESS